MSQILYTLQACGDIQELWDYIADNVGPDNAEALIERINPVLHLILEQPFLLTAVEKSGARRLKTAALVRQTVIAMPPERVLSQALYFVCFRAMFWGEKPKIH